MASHVPDDVLPEEPWKMSGHALRVDTTQQRIHKTHRGITPPPLLGEVVDLGLEAIRLEGLLDELQVQRVNLVDFLRSAILELEI